MLKLTPPRHRQARHCGPVQFWGPASEDPETRLTWHLISFLAQDPTRALREIAELCSELQATAAQARTESTMITVNTLLTNAQSVLASFKQLYDLKADQSEALADMPIEQKPRVRKMRIQGEAAEAQVSSTVSERLGAFSPARRINATAF